MPWMKRLVPFALGLLLLAGPARSQQSSPVIAIRCGRMIDVKAGRAVEKVGFVMKGGVVVKDEMTKR